MNRAELESTAPIKRDELLDLLNAMSATTEQPNLPERQAQLDASRARAARKAAKRAARKAAKRAAKAGAGAPRLYNDVDLDQLLSVAVSAMITPHSPEPVAPPAPTSTSEAARAKRKAPFSHVAALLPACEPTRFPRATRPPPLQSVPIGGRQRAEQRAAQAVAEVRARLDTAEEVAADRLAAREHVWFEVPRSEPPPLRTDMPRVPGDQVIDIHSVPCKELGHSIHLTAGLPPAITAPQPAAPLRIATIIAIFAAFFLVGFFAVYFLR